LLSLVSMAGTESMSLGVALLVGSLVSPQASRRNPGSKKNTDIFLID
jgi:hypothetical protein